MVIVAGALALVIGPFIWLGQMVPGLWSLRKTRLTYMQGSGRENQESLTHLENLFAYAPSIRQAKNWEIIWGNCRKLAGLIALPTVEGSRGRAKMDPRLWCDSGCYDCQLGFIAELETGSGFVRSHMPDWQKYSQHSDRGPTSDRNAIFTAQFKIAAGYG